MDLVAALPGFVLAVLLISASPGPAMALILRRAALRGFSGAVPTVLGLETGLYLWALFAAAGLAGRPGPRFRGRLPRAPRRRSGLSVVPRRPGVALGAAGPEVRRTAGRPARRAAGRGTARRSSGRRTEDAGKRRWASAFGEGLLVMLANPKAAAFMIAFYPQFVPDDRPLFSTTALLALLQVSIEILFYLSLAAVVGRAGAWFRRPAVRRRLEAVTGTVFIALGLRMAADHR